MAVISTHAPLARHPKVGSAIAGLSRRHGLVLAALAALLAVAFALALTLGDYPVSPEAIVTSLLSPITGAANPGVDFIVLNLRLPRALLAIMAGAAFGLSGMVFQSLLRNPLASPDIVGISQGASAAAVFAIIVLGWGGWALSFASLAGALAAAVLMYVLAWRDGINPYRVVLIGIGVAAILQAAISYLFTRARIFEVQEALAWLVGSLNAASFEDIRPLALAMTILVPVTLLTAQGLRVLQLGDDAAKGLGSRVEVTRLSLLACAVALAGFATAAVGPVAFVAFVSGPITREVLRTGRESAPAVMIVGALVMLGSDLIGQHALPGLQLPVGVVTGALGASFLLWLLARSGQKGRIG